MFEVSDDPDRPYNTLVVVDRDGLRASYRKIHLYDSFGYKESDRLLAGPVEPVLVDVGGFRVGLMTCYDLRFPELARELVSRGAELLVVPSAWVAGPAKVDHWRTLATARAIENTVVRRRGRPARPALHRPLAGRRARPGRSSPRSATATTCSPRRWTGTRWTRRARPTRRWPTGASRPAGPGTPRVAILPTSAAGGRHRHRWGLHDRGAR